MKASYCSEYEKSPIPINCSKRYDGCNTCTVVNGTLGSCTEMACVRQQEAKCLEYKPQVEPVPTASIIPA